MSFAAISVAAAIAAHASAPFPASPETLVLSGSVEYRCSLTLLGQDDGSLSLRLERESSAWYTIRCNDRDGFVLQIDSENGGALTSDSHRLPYKLRASASPGAPAEAAFAAGPANVTKVIMGFIPGFAKPTGATYKLELVSDADAEQQISASGGLTDTLTFTVSGN